MSLLMGSLRNKFIYITIILSEENTHILAISETHLDPTFEDSVLSIREYSIYRWDKNAHGGGVAIYIHISVKIRMDLRSNEIEALWLQVHIPHLKPILVGCCYRLPNANSGYLD